MAPIAHSSLSTRENVSTGIQGAETVNVITCENTDMISDLLKNHHPLSCALFVNILTCSYTIVD